jgi:hypothetical protein
VSQVGAEQCRAPQGRSPEIRALRERRTPPQEGTSRPCAERGSGSV